VDCRRISSITVGTIGTIGTIGTLEWSSWVFDHGIDNHSESFWHALLLFKYYQNYSVFDGSGPRSKLDLVTIQIMSKPWRNSKRFWFGITVMEWKNN
jgi:hypothetical protein